MFRIHCRVLGESLLQKNTKKPSKKDGKRKKRQKKTKCIHCAQILIALSVLRPLNEHKIFPLGDFDDDQAKVKMQFCLFQCRIICKGIFFHLHHIHTQKKWKNNNYMACVFFSSSGGRCCFSCRSSVEHFWNNNHKIDAALVAQEWSATKSATTFSLWHISAVKMSIKEKIFPPSLFMIACGLYAHFSPMPSHLTRVVRCFHCTKMVRSIKSTEKMRYFLVRFCVYFFSLFSILFVFFSRFE